jgi:predicted nucleic-acid-binding protein
MGKDKMKITADTNVLVRAAVHDDPHQARQAAKVLQQAELVAVPVPVVCEFVWVLRRGYKKSIPDISDAILRLMQSANVVMNRPAIEAGLSALDAGGDFADGVIAYKGTGWAQKSLCPWTRRLSRCCDRRAVVPAYCHNNRPGTARAPTSGDR